MASHRHRRQRGRARLDEGAIKAFTMLGRVVQIHCRQGDGEFWARVGPDTFSGYTLKEVESAARAAIGKQRQSVRIPCTVMGVDLYAETRSRGFGQHVRKFPRHTCVQAVIVGFDHRHDFVTVRDERTQTILPVNRSYEGHDVLVRRMTPAEVARYEVLYRAQRAASEAFEAFTTRFTLDDPVALVQATLRAAEDDPHEPDDPDEDPR